MNSVQILNNLIRDYDKELEFLHEMAVNGYINLKECRNAREEIVSVRDQLLGKNINEKE